MSTKHSIEAPEQLSLLSVSSVPLQFRLDERTRRSGLQHVAELRAQIAAQAARRRHTVAAPATDTPAPTNRQRHLAA